MLPDEEPQDVDCRVDDEHGVEAEGVAADKAGELDEAEGDGAPHVDAGTSEAVEEVAVEGGYGHEGAPQAQYLHDGYAWEPFVGDGEDDDLFCHEGEAEHGGEGEEGDETDEFAEDAAQALGVGGGVAEDGLAHAVGHAGEGGVAHGGPLVALSEIAG